MKTILLASAIALLSVPALVGGAYAQSQSGSESHSGAQAGVNINSHSSRQAPSAIGPGLTASGLSCSGSTSLGGSGAGFGISFGMTRADKNCDAREDAKYIQAITNNTLAAKARLCTTAETREAFRLAGDPCPQDYARASQSARTTTVSAPQPAQKRVAFNSMRECQAYASRNPGFVCRAR